MAACVTINRETIREEIEQNVSESRTEMSLLTDCDSLTEVVGKVEDEDQCLCSDSVSSSEHSQSSSTQLTKLAKFHECLGPVDSCPQLKSILPPGYDYVICNLFPFETYNGEDRFSTVFRLPFGTAEEAEQWLYEFQSSSKTTWRVDKTYPDPQTKVIFKKDYHCQHNTRSTSHKDRNIQNSHKKNTNCPAKLTITVKKFAKKTKSEDPHAKTHATMVSLKQTHNHQVMMGDALRHRPVSNGVRAKFVELYKGGLTPPQALAKHQSELRDEFGDSYGEAIVDRHLCPDIHWCYRLYYKLYRAKNSGLRDDTMRLEARANSTETLLRNFTDGLCSQLRKRPKIFVPVVEKLLSYSQTLFDDDSEFSRISMGHLTDDEKNSVEVFSGFIDPATGQAPRLHRSKVDHAGIKRPRKKTRLSKSAHTMEHDYSSLRPAGAQDGVVSDSKAFTRPIIIPASYSPSVVLSNDLCVNSFTESWGIMFGQQCDVQTRVAQFEAVTRSEQQVVETLVTPQPTNDPMKETLMDVAMQYDVDQASSQTCHFISDDSAHINIVHVNPSQSNDVGSVADLKELLRCF